MKDRQIVALSGALTNDRNSALSGIQQRLNRLHELRDSLPSSYDDEVLQAEKWLHDQFQPGNLCDGLQTVSPDLYSRLSQHFEKRRTKLANKSERSLDNVFLQYLLRTCLKTSPLSTFTVIYHGSWQADGIPSLRSELESLPVRRQVSLRRSLLQELLNPVIKSFSVDHDATRIWLNTTLRLDGDSFVLHKRQEASSLRGMTWGVGLEQVRLKVNPALRLIIEGFRRAGTRGMTVRDAARLFKKADDENVAEISGVDVGGKLDSQAVQEDTHVDIESHSIKPDALGHFREDLECLIDILPVFDMNSSLQSWLAARFVETFGESGECTDISGFLTSQMQYFDNGIIAPWTIASMRTRCDVVDRLLQLADTVFNHAVANMGDHEGEAYIDPGFARETAARIPERVQNRPTSFSFFTVLALNIDGNKEVLGLYLSESEGANFWLSVLTDRQNRGVEDLLIPSGDGLTGFPEATASIDPDTEVPRCIGHPIRHSRRVVAGKNHKAFRVDRKRVYRAQSLGEAVHRQFCKRTKTQGGFPNDDRLLKLVHMSIINASKNGPCRSRTET